MKLTKDLGILLLGLWLIITGLMQAFSLSFQYSDIIMAVLAIVAGVALFFRR